MAFKSVALAFTITVLAVAQIPPNFTPSASRQLGVAYGPGDSNTRIVTPGDQLLQTSETSLAPALGLNFMPSVQGSYLLTMIDPDAPVARRQILHWLQPNLSLTISTDGLFQYSLTNSSPPIAPFAQPRPSEGSGAHRYIQYLWSQPVDFSIPAAWSGYSTTNRTMFDLASFAAAAGLGEPIAANYFLTANANETANASSPSSTSPMPSQTSVAPYEGASASIRVGSTGLYIALVMSILFVCL